MSEVRHGTRSAEVIEVIRVTGTRGDGKDTWFREVVTYWTTDGRLLAEVDPLAPEDGAR